MDTVETEGESIDAAIENAVRLLGVTRDQITIEVVAEGRRGILGFGSQKAKVRAQLRRPALAAEPEAGPRAAAAAEEAVEPQHQRETIERAKTVLQHILERVGVSATVTVKSSLRGDETILDVQTEHSGVLIGRKGQTLEALQYLVTRIASERQGSDAPHVVIDVENYRERRRRSLEDLALRLGEKAKRQRKTVAIDALSAADRRIVHAALQDDPWLSTKSLGQGAYRRLLIIPEGDRKTRETSAPAKQGGTAPESDSKSDPTPSADPDED